MHRGVVALVALVRCALLHHRCEHLLDQRLLARSWLPWAPFWAGSRRSMGASRLACVAHDRMPPSSATVPDSTARVAVARGITPGNVHGAAVEEGSTSRQDQTLANSGCGPRTRTTSRRPNFDSSSPDRCARCATSNNADQIAPGVDKGHGFDVTTRRITALRPAPGRSKTGDLDHDEQNVSAELMHRIDADIEHWWNAAREHSAARLPRRDARMGFDPSRAVRCPPCPRVVGRR
jgi:hypothetical protein